MCEIGRAKPADADLVRPAASFFTGRGVCGQEETGVSVLGGYLFIFVARCVDVCLATLRILMVMRARRIAAAAVGFFEAVVWVLVVARVMAHLDNPVNLLVYALGFASGTYVGGIIEEKVAVGHLTLQVICDDAHGAAMAEMLRDKGFAVTTMDAQGRDGPRKIIYVIAGRRWVPHVMGAVRAIDETAFVSVVDSRVAQGGFFSRKHEK